MPLKPTWRIILLFLGLFSLASAPFASAKDEADEELVLEAYPDELTLKLAAYYGQLEAAKLAGPEATRGVVSSLHLWSTVNNKTRNPKQINVCFFEGHDDSLKTRKEVAKIAREWTKVGGLVPLNFGDPDTSPTCTGKSAEEHIRIRLKFNGAIWSAVGQQSTLETLFPRHKPSMNIGIDPKWSFFKFRRAVLHEFGHALGLEHEHQNEYLKCWDEEFDKRKVAKFLRKKRGWRKRMVELNLSILHRKGVIAISPDPKSVMMYSFPSRFYKKHQESPCYCEEHDRISRCVAFIC